MKQEHPTPSPSEQTHRLLGRPDLIPSSPAADGGNVELMERLRRGTLLMTEQLAAIGGNIGGVRFGFAYTPSDIVTVNEERNMVLGLSSRKTGAVGPKLVKGGREIVRGIAGSDFGDDGIDFSEALEAENKADDSDEDDAFARRRAASRAVRDVQRAAAKAKAEEEEKEGGRGFFASFWNRTASESSDTDTRSSRWSMEF